MLRGIKTSVEIAVEEKRCRQMKLSRSYREAIEGPRTIPIDPPVVETAIEIAIRNGLRS